MSGFNKKGSRRNWREAKPPCDPLPKLQLGPMLLVSDGPLSSKIIRYDQATGDQLPIRVRQHPALSAARRAKKKEELIKEIQSDLDIELDL